MAAAGRASWGAKCARRIALGADRPRKTRCAICHVCSREARCRANTTFSLPSPHIVEPQQAERSKRLGRGHLGAPIVVVATLVGDLAEVAEGGGTGSLVEGSVEFRDGDCGLGSEPREQQVGRVLGHADSVSTEAGVLSIQSRSNEALGSVRRLILENMSLVAAAHS